MKLRILATVHRFSPVIAGTLISICTFPLANGGTGAANKHVPQSAVPVTVTVVSSSALPMNFELKQNYPNPFNPSTTIGYSIPAEAKVTLEVLDVLGRKVATLVDAVQSAGFHSCRWEANDVPSGVYFYRMKAGTYTKTLKMIQLK